MAVKVQNEENLELFLIGNAVFKKHEGNGLNLLRMTII